MNNSGLTDADVQRVFGITRPHAKLLTYYVLKSLITGPAFPIAFLLYYRVYRTLLYRFTHEGITESWGRFWRREVYLTYGRIQDIHISRDLFQRWLGLGTIHIQTASGSSKPEMSIDGLLEYELVRDFLYSRMRGAGPAPASPPQESRTQPGVDIEGEGILPLLAEIRTELRAIRESLEGRQR